MLDQIGFGTFGSDRYDEETVARAVYEAIRCGYRTFDCASVYGNERQIGNVFRRAFEEGLVARDALTIISKVWNDMHGEGQVIASCKQSLKDLGLEYLDLYILHWPFPNYHAKGCSGDSRSPDSRPFFVEDFMVAWRQMEQLKRDGLVREIATSNMTIPKFEAVLPLCEIRPYANEMELHPSFQQPELYDYCKAHGMQVIGFCPLGSPNRPDRDRTAEDVVDTKLPVIQSLAQEHGCSPQEICLRWAVTRGHTPIPFSGNPRNIASNLAAVRDPLSAEEMARIRAADCNCRLVKGQVFLWPGSDDWRDLWDLDGKLDHWVYQDNTWLKENL
ncbi:MAG: aldo/keto reductase family protein [Clostridia bacterium]